MKYFSLLSLVLCFFIGEKAFGQNSYRLTYTDSNPLDGFAKVERFTRVILTDSSIFIFPVTRPSVKTEKTTYGADIKHHSMYFFSRQRLYYYGNHFPRLSKPTLTVGSKMTKRAPWIADTTITHYYQKYRCANAYRVENNGDTSFAVYTPDIKYPPGYEIEPGIPGIILERADAGYYSRLTKLEVGNFAVLLPKNAEKLIRSKK